MEQFGQLGGAGPSSDLKKIILFRVRKGDTIFDPPLGFYSFSGGINSVLERPSLLPLLPFHFCRVFNQF